MDIELIQGIALFTAPFICPRNTLSLFPGKCQWHNNIYVCVAIHFPNPPQPPPPPPPPATHNKGTFRLPIHVPHSFRFISTCRSRNGTRFGRYSHPARTLPSRRFIFIWGDTTIIMPDVLFIPSQLQFIQIIDIYIELCAEQRTRNSHDEMDGNRKGWIAEGKKETIENIRRLFQLIAIDCLYLDGDDIGWDRGHRMDNVRG